MRAFPWKYTWSNIGRSKEGLSSAVQAGDELRAIVGNAVLVFSRE